MSRHRTPLGALVPFILFALAAALAPPPSSASVARRLALLSGADTIAVERWESGDGRFDGWLDFRAADARITYALTLAPGAAGGPARPRELVLSVPGAAGAAPKAVATFTWKGDSVIVTQGAMRLPLLLGADTWPFANPSMALLARAMRDVHPAAGETLHRALVLASGATPASAAVRALGGDSLSVTLGGVEMRLARDAQGELTGGDVPAQGLRIVVTTAAGAAALPAAAKPDYAAPADAPYTAEGVRVPAPGGFTLAGTLTVPKGARGPLPCVLFVTGSGLEDRDEAIPLVKGYRPFRQFADAFARAGIASLRLDDRGFGESGGVPDSATTADFAGDARAALAWLRARSGIDGARLVVVGHSEGALIATMIGADGPAVRAIVSLDGPARDGRRIIEYQNRYALEHEPGADSARVAGRLREAMAELDATAARKPWIRYFLACDPATYARRVRVPVLVVQGGNDRQVTADQADELAAAIRSGGNRDITVRLIPGVNHLLLADADGNPAGYAKLGVHEIDARVLADVAGWVGARTR